MFKGSVVNLKGIELNYTNIRIAESVKILNHLHGFFLSFKYSGLMTPKAKTTFRFQDTRNRMKIKKIINTSSYRIGI